MRYGEPRTTIDLDVVVALPPSRAEAFCSEFPATDFYVDPETVKQATLHRTTFNILHSASGYKIDVMLTDRSEYNEARLKRVRLLTNNDGLRVVYASPEDVIIKKMEFYKIGRSDKHIRDIAGILKVNGPHIDREYIERWARKFNVMDVWQLATDRAKSG